MAFKGNLLVNLLLRIDWIPKKGKDHFLGERVFTKPSLLEVTICFDTILPVFFAEEFAVFKEVGPFAFFFSVFQHSFPS
jgi:hypothetical protein